jgi:hypothetical protein
LSFSLTGNLFSPEDIAKSKEILESFELNIILQDSVEQRVLRAAQMWLRQDLTCDKILVEREFDFKGGAKGIIDLAFMAGGKAWLVDWKTTGSIKRPHFNADISNDFQTSLYLSAAGDYIQELWGVRPDFLEYRCLDEEMEVTSFRVPYEGAKTHADANSQLLAVAAQYRGLIGLPPEQPWARNRPFSCFKGSRTGAPTCPFWKDCTNMTMPPTPLDVDFEAIVPRSKSSLKAFIECPERWRRERLFTSISFSNDYIKVGNAFHLLAAHLWEQAWKNLKGEQNDSQN